MYVNRFISLVHILSITQKLTHTMVVTAVITTFIVKKYCNRDSSLMWIYKINIMETLCKLSNECDCVNNKSSF